MNEPSGCIHTIREARPSDNDALIKLELRCPLDLGNVELVMDRRPDFFAQTQVQEHSLVLVAEEEGKLVGVVAGAWHDVPLLGDTRHLLYVHHERILPSHQGKGLGRALVMELVARTREAGIHSLYWLIVPSNERSMRFAQSAGIQRWPVAGRLCQMDLAAAAHSPRVRTLERERAGEAASLINVAHGGLELFSPFTGHRLRERLARTDAYTWGDYYGLFDGERLVAVGGLWDQGRSLAFIRRHRRDGSTSFSRAMPVVDYGFTPGAEAAMVEMLQHLAALAVDRGRNELALGLPPPGPLDVLLQGLPHTVDEFCCFIPVIPVPEEGAIKGIHLDPFYL